MAFGHVLVAVSVCWLIYAGFQMLQFKDYVKANADVSAEAESMPVDIVIQTFVALALGIFGTASLTKEFQPIKAHIAYSKETADDVSNMSQSEFLTFRHRSTKQ